MADHDIRVNAVAPGTIAIKLASKAVLTSRAATAKVTSRTLLKRLGKPQKIAGVGTVSASDPASYITGEIVVADGGRVALDYAV